MTALQEQSGEGGASELHDDVAGYPPPGKVAAQREGDAHSRVEVRARDLAHEEDDRHHHQPGCDHRRLSADLPRERVAHHPAARGHQHEEERAEQLGEEAPPFLTRILEVEDPVDDALLEHLHRFDDARHAETPPRPRCGRGDRPRWRHRSSCRGTARKRALNSWATRAGPRRCGCCSRTGRAARSRFRTAAAWAQQPPIRLLRDEAHAEAGHGMRDVRLLEPGDLVVAELDVDGGDRVLEVVRFGGADDRRGDHRASTASTPTRPAPCGTPRSSAISADAVDDDAIRRRGVEDASELVAARSAPSCRPIRARDDRARAGSTGSRRCPGRRTAAASRAPLRGSAGCSGPACSRNASSRVRRRCRAPSRTATRTSTRRRGSAPCPRARRRGGPRGSPPSARADRDGGSGRGRCSRCRAVARLWSTSVMIALRDSPDAVRTRAHHAVHLGRDHDLVAVRVTSAARGRGTLRSSLPSTRWRCRRS